MATPSEEYEDECADEGMVVQACGRLFKEKRRESALVGVGELAQARAAEKDDEPVQRVQPPS